jgi:hypothetical protein
MKSYMLIEKDTKFYRCYLIINTIIFLLAALLFAYVILKGVI